MRRTFRDGRHETWWAMEVEAGPYGPWRARRALVVTTDPERLPRLGIWYLNTNLPHPDSERETWGELLAPASVAEIVRLYGLRMWVEQSYKQVKHALGWSDYQVRSDTAIRRHWQVVLCAFSFCWWACGEELDLGNPPGAVLETDGERPPETSQTAEARGKRSTRPPLPSWPRALRRVRAWLEPYITQVAPYPGKQYPPDPKAA